MSDQPGTVTLELIGQILVDPQLDVRGVKSDMAFMKADMADTR